MVRVMLSWICAMLLSTRLYCQGSRVSLPRVTCGDMVATAWQEDAAANSMFRNQSKGWK